MLKQRLMKVVDIAYDILGNKIASGSIVVYNEASLQLQFGLILKTLGQLYEYSPDEHFIVLLETPQKVSTAKSQKGNARCDIKLILDSGKENQCTAYIELKYLKKSTKKSSDEAVTDNRFSVWADVENLEQYKGESNDIGYEIVFTNNANHTEPKQTKFCIGEGLSILPGKYPHTKNRKITIKGTYPLQWTTLVEKKYLLKIDIM